MVTPTQVSAKFLLQNGLRLTQTVTHMGPGLDETNEASSAKQYIHS